jgi:hypothetical protein
MIDWDSLVTNPIHSIFGVSATLTLNDSSGTVITLTDLIDETKGVLVDPSTMDAQRNMQNVEVQTAVPAVLVKRTDLGDFDRSDLRDSELVLNGVTWKVRNHSMLQTPGGADTGQVRLFLRKAS